MLIVAMSRLIRATVVSALIALVFSACGSSRETTPIATPPSRPVIEDPSVIAVIGTEQITLKEFEREYAKSAGGRKNAADDSLGAYEDFLSRYVDFRLKVAEARSAGFANDSSLQAEATSYRNSIARPYMIEQEILGPIMRDLFARSQEVVSTSHILVQVSPNSAPADTLVAYERAAALLDSLKSGADFEELARKYSEDPSAQSSSGPGAGGFLGFLPAGTLVPEFEEMAYSTPAGEVSPIFRTQFGYHLLRVNGREPAVPDIRVAHIMVVSGDPTIADPAAFLDSLKLRIDAGEDFASLARQYSMHQESAHNGGDLGIYLSRYAESGTPPAFQEAAFKLQEVGDISDVVETPYGYHLIQLLERRDTGDFASMEAQLKQMATRSPRAREAQREYLEDIHTRYNLSVDSTFAFNALAGFDPDTLATVLRTKALPPETLSDTVIVLGDSIYTMADFATFAARISLPAIQTSKAQVIYLLNGYISNITISYATETLEQRNEEFKSIMDDFRDGLLLFRIMEDSVWNAASADSAALLKLYEANADRYQFPERTRAVVFRSDDKAVLNRVGEQLGVGRSAWEIQAAFAADDSTQLRIDTVFVAQGTNSMYNSVLAIDESMHTEPISVTDGHMVLLRDGQEAARPKTFLEARAEVINEYQEILEQKLLRRLHEKYAVYTYPERLSRAFEPEGPTPAGSLTAK